MPQEKCCATRYPVLLVHGAFFRDVHWLSYWGRIPAALEQNGAAVYFGNQQSAESVEASAAFEAPDETNARSRILFYPWVKQNDRISEPSAF